VHGKIVLDDSAKVDALNVHFSSTGEEGKFDCYDDQHRDYVERSLRECDRLFEPSSGDDLPENGPIRKSEVQFAISSLRSRSACGSDGIHALMIQRGGPWVVTTLLHIFGVSWSQGMLVSDWKRARIVPIPKFSGAISLGDFRPISLLSIVAKLMERIIKARISYLAESGHWFSDCQGAYRKHRSVTDLLFDFSHGISSCFSRREVCVTAFLDISKAYDRVWRKGLLHKLVKLGVCGRLLRWVSDFLSERSAHVRYANTHSSDRAYRFGIPQGSVLSPVLFNVFLSDLFSDVHLDDRFSACVFADDIRLSVCATTIEQAAELLSDRLSGIDSWGYRNRVCFCKDKCKCMVFARKPTADVVVHFGDVALEFRPVLRYLGVWWDRTLSFSAHLIKVRAKGWRALSSVRSLAGRSWGIPIKSMIQLYVCAVRPVLEFASPVWDCCSMFSKSRLDSIQRVALLAITGAESSTSLVSLQVYCNIQPLQLRRDMHTADALLRIYRLDVTHPIFRSFCSWNITCDTLHHSVFYRATALLTRFSRSSDFSDGGHRWAECIPSVDSFAPPWEESFLPHCRQASLRSPLHIFLFRCIHALFVSISAFSSDLLVYTDGSCTTSGFGKCGAAAVFRFGERWCVTSSSVGVGTSLTAELSAIALALSGVSRTLLSCDVRVGAVMIFSDCRIAVQLCLSNAMPRSHVDLIVGIRLHLRQLGSVASISLSWIPSHCGIQGNEIADKASKVAASRVVGFGPCAMQPLVTLFASRVLVRSAIQHSWQMAWARSMPSHAGVDCLARLIPIVSHWPVIFLGSRREQTLLARLRLGHCRLQYHTSRFSPHNDGLCHCGEMETVCHFLIWCPRYAASRVILFSEVSSVYSYAITEQVLLGKPVGKLSVRAHRLIISAVFTFVVSTGRHL
jgi:ribonuclease HI